MKTATVALILFVLVNTITQSSASSSRPAPSIPFTINSLDFEFPVDEQGSSCPGPNAQRTHDATCPGPCYIAFTQPGHTVGYNFETSRDYIIREEDGGEHIHVDIVLRVASFNPNKQLQLEIWDGMDFDHFDGPDPDMGEMGPMERFDTPGLGYHVFQDITWRMVPLQPDLTHRLWVHFVGGNTNLCSVSIVPSRQSPSVPPLYTIIWGALDYFDAVDNSPKHLGTCGDGPVDAQPTEDALCVQRDQSPCNIAFTEPGEYLQYHFYTNDSDDYDVWVRVASARDNRKIRLELYPLGGPTMIKTLDVRNDGWQGFHDLVWELLYLDENYYTLRVYFETGGVNLCSVAVKPSTRRYNLFVPGNYTALMYYDFIELGTVRRGNCPSEGVWFGGKSPDAQINKDPICNQAHSESEVACNLGWSEPGEAVFYTFDLDEKHEYVNLFFRVASNSAKKSFRVKVNDQSSRTFTSPGKGWQQFETVIWNNVSTEGRKSMVVGVAFVDGNVNLCAVGAEYNDP